MENGGLTFDRRKTAGITLEVACGSCLGCRLDHSLMWAIRIVHESTLHRDQHGNSFVTLTYRDPWECTTEQRRKLHHIPHDGSLHPSHVSKFIRRLRKTVEQKIRYFYCGEYGDENQRPHYHLCIFNYSPGDERVYKDEEGIITYESESLKKLWPYGFSTSQELGFENAAYTARYSLKKITGKKAWEHYLRCDEHGEAYWLLPEYIRMSTGRKKPAGLGADYYEKYKEEIFPSNEVSVPGVGVLRKVPRYYADILQSEDPETRETVRLLRQQFILAHGHDFTPDRLRQKAIVASASQRTRSL